MIFLFVILLAAGLLLSNIQGDKNLRLCVNIDGDEHMYSLDNDFTEEFIGNDGIVLTLAVENGEVYVLHSECKDKVCQNSGKISKSGQIIVCAPAKISIRIIGSEDSFDALTR